MYTMLRFIAFLLLSALVQACSQQTQPDLERLYRQTQFVEQPPVILIHGIMGARLSDSGSGEEAWPGGISRLAFSDYKELGLEIDATTLEPMNSRFYPSGLADEVAGRDFYGAILRTLEEAGRYRRANPDEPANAKHREV
jgi:hypothetical protein